jgi:hypothetical protein
MPLRRPKRGGWRVRGLASGSAVSVVARAVWTGLAQVRTLTLIESMGKTTECSEIPAWGQL